MPSDVSSSSNIRSIPAVSATPHQDPSVEEGNQSLSRGTRVLVFLKKNHRYIPIVSTITGLWEATIQLLKAISFAVAFPPTGCAYIIARILQSEKSQMIKNIALGSLLGAVECGAKAVASTVVAIPFVGNIIALVCDKTLFKKSPPVL